MGFLSDIAASAKAKAVPQTGNLWNRVFGTAKETGGMGGRPASDPNGGGLTRSLSATQQGFKHFLTALRSMAPGGWTDDRWTQANSQHGATQIAVRAIGTRLQQAEFQVSHRDPSAPDGKRPVLEGDPPEGERVVKPYDLVKLLQSPNPHDYFGKLMYRWIQQKVLTGTAITMMVPNQLSVPMELYCLETAVAVPMPVMTADFPQGAYRVQPVYPYGPFTSYPLPNAAVGALVDARWTFKFTYPHPLYRYEGYSPQTGMRLELDVLEAINRSRWYKMRRGSNPDAVLNMEKADAGAPTTEEEILRLQAQYEAAMQGPENHGKLLIPPTGTTLEQFGTSPKDMDYQTGWAQMLDFVMGGFGVPKAAAGMTDDTNYSQLYASLRQLDLITLGPEVADVAAVLTRSLAPFFGDDLIVEIRCPKIDDHEITFKKVGEVSALKGMPESVIRFAFTLMDLPQDETVIKDLAGAKEQAGPEGALEAVPGNAPELTESAESVNEETGEPVKPEGERAEPLEVTRSRPDPGSLSEGSLGPRGPVGKSLARRIKHLRNKPPPQKLVYERVGKDCANGHAK